MSEKTYFNRALSSLRNKFPELRAELKILKDNKKKALELFRWVLLGDIKKEIREYHFFLNGIIVKTLTLSENMLIELDRQDPYSSNMILRAHYESLAAVHYFARHPEKRRNLTFGEKLTKKEEGSLEAVNVMDMLRELTKNVPENWDVMKDYETASNVIHPNKRSHQANIKTKEETILEFSSYCNLDKKQVENLLKANNVLVTSILNGVSDIDELFVKGLNITKKMPPISTK